MPCLGLVIGRPVSRVLVLEWGAGYSIMERQSGPVQGVLVLQPVTGCWCRTGNGAACWGDLLWGPAVDPVTGDCCGGTG